MLSHLPQLKRLIGNGSPPSHVASLALPQLTELVMGNCMRVTDLGPLVACMALRRLVVSGGKLLTDISVLRSCLDLMWLDVSFCGSLIDITPMATLSVLETLDLTKCDCVRDLDPLAACTGASGLLWVPQQQRRECTAVVPQLDGAECQSV